MKRTFNIIVMVAYIVILINLIQGNGVTVFVAVLMALQGIAHFAQKAFTAKHPDIIEAKKVN